MDRPEFAVFFHMTLFVDDSRDDREVRRRDRAADPIEERGASAGRAQNMKIPMLLPNLVAVQHHAVMPPKVKFEPLECRVNAVDVRGLVHHAKGQHEHGMLLIDRREAVVAAFVDVDDVVAECHAALF